MLQADDSSDDNEVIVEFVVESMCVHLNLNTVTDVKSGDREEGEGRGQEVPVLRKRMLMPGLKSKPSTWISSLTHTERGVMTDTLCDNKKQ